MEESSSPLDESSSSEENRRAALYPERVGEKLKRLRQERGLSLQDVCERSGGAFVVSTLSAYEHGKRSLSLERLVELSDIYGVSPTALLDVEEPVGSTLERVQPLRINLRRLDRLEKEERMPLEHYLDFLRRLRNDPATEVLTIRRDDLAYLAQLYGVRPEALKTRLREVGIIE